MSYGYNGTKIIKRHIKLFLWFINNLSVLSFSMLSPLLSSPFSPLSLRLSLSLSPPSTPQSNFDENGALMSKGQFNKT